MAIGAVLGGLNSAAIGVGMALQTTHSISSLVMVAVVMFTSGAGLGLLLGLLASALTDRSHTVRRVVILGLPLLAVVIGASAIELRTRAGASVPVALASKVR